MFPLPATIDGYHCVLEAVDDGRNIARSYRIHAVRDLFGHVLIEVRWGRIGQRGVGRRLSFPNESTARLFIRRTLLRRASAERRIGVAYRLRAPS